VISISQIKELTVDLNTDHSLEQYRDEHRLAAVLILVVQGLDEPEIILTRRSANLSNHAGQISFPGGTVEDADIDPVFTALREASEEIDLQKNDVEILGILNTTTLPSGFAVSPVLAVMHSSPVLTANPDEVDEIFSIPLSLICDLSLYGQDSLTRDGIRREFYFLNYEEYYIWGATAKMLRTLAKILNTSSDA
jgi:8-oxo-dGTP pyrophosphatase MutT (NUDIX family)